MALKIQLARGTRVAWATVNPILMAGEIGLELDTRRRKRGDGINHWNDLPYEQGPIILKTIGALTHTGDALRTSLDTTLVPAFTIGIDGQLQVMLGARITGGAPTGPWLVELELGGDVIAQFQSLEQTQTFLQCVLHNQNDLALQVAMAETVRDLTIDTTVDQNIELFVTLDAADTALSVEVFSFVAEVNVR